jgi:uncharacterized membrane protein
MTRQFKLSILFVLASLAVGAYLYPQMPESFASHWGAQGEVNGHMPKIWGAFMLPLITILLLIFFHVIPLIDPLKENIKSFRPYYDNFILIFASFMTLIYLQTILWNIGIRINPMAVISIGLFALFYYSGVLIQHAKRNWFIGIRTPWTLTSDTVWEKTHKVGGRMFKICGLLALTGALLPKYAIAFILVPVLLTAAYTTAYSYLEYQKEKK